MPGPYLHSCLMLVEGVYWMITVCHTVDARVPKTQQVVISSTGQILPIRRPLQTTHFLGVLFQSANMVVSNTHIMVVNCSITTSTAGKHEMENVDVMQQIKTMVMLQYNHCEAEVWRGSLEELQIECKILIQENV